MLSPFMIWFVMIMKRERSMDYERGYPGYHLVKSTVLILDKVILSLDLSCHILKIKILALKIFKANQL